MSTILPDAPPTEWTIADVRARLRGFPAWRIHTYPAPGTATEKDLWRAEARSGRICELIDGTLVEKVMWCIRPKTRTARAYTAEHEWTEIGPTDSLLGGEVLPGFQLPLAQLFARVEGPRKG